MNENREWTKFYAQGTPKDIEPVTGSLYDLLEQRVDEYGEKDAYSFFGRTATFNQLGDAVLRVANGLRKLGVKKGDRVALVMPNAPQHIVAFYALARLGAIMVEHNPLYTAAELEKQFKDHRATVVIAWDKTVETIQSLAPKYGIEQIVSVNVTKAMPLKMQLLMRLPIEKAREARAKLTTKVTGTVPFEELLKSAPLSNTVQRPSADDIMALQYTSGTTGDPKGAILTHKNLWSNARQGAAWMPNFQQASGSIYGLLPMFHSFGLLLSAIYPVEKGARAVLFPTFDPELIIEAAKKFPPTFMPAVPPMFDRMARVARDGDLDLTQIVYSISGAMTLTPQVVKRWEDLAGSMLNEGYGLTEASPVALANPFSDKRKIGAIGLPFPSTHMKVVDQNDPTVEVEQGQPGELLLQGPQIFQGYWNRPEETASTLLEGGWLRTGDLVVQDEEGFVTVVDRKKELIITGGYNVSPSEVEAAINEAPGVLESAVVGVPRGSGAEIVTAAVILEEGATFDENAVRAIAKEKLSEYKRPTSYIVWEELPKSLIGKVQRRQVRDALIQDRKATRALPTEE